MLAWLGVLAACSSPPAEDRGPVPPVFADDAARWVGGAIHVHSTYTDGAGPVSEISNAAAAAGLDFFVLTDHWTLDALVEGEEGYRDGVLMLVGVEATTSVGHVLGFDLPATPLRFGRRDPDEVLGQIRELGGFSVVAHPDGGRDNFRWTGWEVKGYEGIEVFNAYSTYMRKGVLKSLAYFLLDPFLQTDLFEWELDWNTELVGTWDRLLAERKLAAWGGLDSHGGIELAEGRFIPWPSYEMVFRMGRNYLLLEEPLTGSVAEDRELIYDAMRSGRGYFALGSDRDGSEFRFWAEADGRRWPVGSDLDSAAVGFPVTLRAVAGGPEVELQLYRDGVPVARTSTGELTFEVNGDGVYRVEAYARVQRVRGSALEPWIISNPISILPRGQIQARVDANDPAEPNRFTNVGTPIPYPLTPEALVRGACLEMDFTADRSGDGFRVGFQLGVPSPGTPDSFVEPHGRCAVIDARAHDFSEYQAIQFEARADRIHRVNLLLTGSDANLLTDGIGWTWSFLTYDDWRTVTLPLDRFYGVRNRDPGTDDLSAITGVAFLFDTSNTRPGSSGEVEIRNVSLVPIAR